MHTARGGEENICWSKRLSMFTTDVFTGTRSDKINFVARVWLLWIDAARRVDFNQQTAVLEDGCEALAFWSRQTLECFCNSCSDTGNV